MSIENLEQLDNSQPSLHFTKPKHLDSLSSAGRVRRLLTEAESRQAALTNPIHRLGYGREVALAFARKSRLTPLRTERYITLQKWQGIVHSIGSEFFVARIVDLTNPQNVDEEVELPIAEVPEVDMSVFQVGATFYWTIGYHDSRTGQRTRFSVIRLRRLPPWSDKDLKAADEYASQLKKIGWE